MIGRFFASTLGRHTRLLPFAILGGLVAAACATSDPEPTAQPSSPDASSPSTEIEAGTPDTSTPVTPSGTCGNGKVDVGESCDDGNTTAGDGCSPTCQRESSGPEDVCNGAEIALTADGLGGATGTVTSSTSALHGFYEGTCGGKGGNEAVYSVTPTVTGVLTARMSAATFDPVLYARRTCEAASSEAACEDVSGTGGGEVLTMTVEAGKPVFLFVDSFGSTKGNFTLDVSVQPSYCGDGIAQLPEVCDDGNTVAGDGCSPTCTFEEVGIVNNCPGQGIGIVGSGTSPRSISIAGDTTDLSGTLAATGCIAGGYNAVYQFRSDIDGKLTAKLTASYAEPVLQARSDCSKTDLVAAGSQMACAERVGRPASNDPLVIEVPVEKGIPVFLNVDANKIGEIGPFRLDLTVVPAACSNDLVEGTEQCDDGNTVSGDGCSATCTLEATTTAADVCPGVPIVLTADPADANRFAGVVTSSTAALTGNYAGSCASTTSSQANDAVYAITAPVTGRLTTTVHADFSATLYARATCLAATPEAGCSAKYAWTTPETMGVPVTKGDVVYVFVDGKLAGSAGTFTLHTNVTSAACGNGVVDGGEQCDDGNGKGSDGCSDTCQNEPVQYDTCAAPGVIALTSTSADTWTASVYGGTTNLNNNQSFLPNVGCTSNGKDAIYTFAAPADGVASVTANSNFAITLGVRNAGTCPANTTATYPLACTQTLATVPAKLLFPVTKDQTYYVIVDSPLLTDQGVFTLDVNVSTPKCGDGMTSGAETCDDGNTTSGDGCSSTCMLETLAGVESCPGYVVPLAQSAQSTFGALVTVDTRQLSSTYSGKCGGSGSEGIVAVTAPINGRLTAKLRGLGTIYARTSCTAPGTELACKSDVPPAVTPSRDITFTVIAGSTYYLFLDGYAGSSGLGTVEITVTP